MAESILDPENGNTAAVTDRRRLTVNAATTSEEHEVSIATERAFFANTTTAANTLTVSAGGPILYLKNDDNSRNMIVEKVSTSSSVAGGVVVWTRNPVLGTIGNEVTATIVNMNFGSNIPSQVTGYSWDESGGTAMSGFSGGSILKTFITGVGFTIHPIDAAVVIPPGSSFLISYSNASTAEFECGVRFYMEAK